MSLAFPSLYFIATLLVSKQAVKFKVIKESTITATILQATMSRFNKWTNINIPVIEQSTIIVKLVSIIGLASDWLLFLSLKRLSLLRLTVKGLMPFTLLFDVISTNFLHNLPLTIVHRGILSLRSKLIGTFCSSSTDYRYL